MANRTVHKNDSSQMKAILHPDSHSDFAHDEKNREEGERDATERSRDSSCSSTGVAVNKQLVASTEESTVSCYSSELAHLGKTQDDGERDVPENSRESSSSSTAMAVYKYRKENTSEQSGTSTVESKASHCPSHFAHIEKNQKDGERDVTKSLRETSSSSTAGAVQKRRKEKTSEPVGAWTEEPTHSCCSMAELKRLPQCHVKLERLSYSRTHTVLIDVSVYNSGGGLIAQKGRDMWHKNFVKMPYSSDNVMTVLLKKPTKVRRWLVISEHLEALSKKTAVTANDVAQTILKYNPKYNGQWSFDALFSFVKCVPDMENYFTTLFPKIAALALKLPCHVHKSIPLLQKRQTASITLSQVQISCLLANAFLCTFPHRNTSSPDAEYHNYPTINFNSLFGNWSRRKDEKLRTIMHYFKVVTDKTTEPRGLVTFERRSLRDTERPDWRSCNEKMPNLHVTSRGTIEAEGTGMLQVDFACNLIGGGVLGSGLLQEEILFLMNPELIVARLFTEKLEDSECLIVTGSQQFSSYSGFSDSFEWAGPHEDRLKRDEWARLQRQILAIDALHFRQRREQYNMKKITRELNKAYCGFKKHGLNEPDIATGQWGCGAFKGDPQLKAVIQLMAAAVARRGLCFFTFGDDKLQEGLQQIHHVLVTKGITVGKLYSHLEDYCAVQHTSDMDHVDLFVFIGNTFGSSRSVHGRWD